MFNESILHFTNPNLPFGGVGDSGIGQYHGKLTFDTFVHKKAVIKSISSRYFDMPFRYPPFNSLFVCFCIFFNFFLIFF